jgi:hypothetical protein
MGAFESLMKRLGYVKLSQYGLVLAPDGRVIPLASEAEPTWDSPRLAPVALPFAPTVPQPARPRAAPPPAPPPVPVAPPVTAALAPAPVVEEDEWEWEIAVARARAAAEGPTVAVPRAAAPRVTQPRVAAAPVKAAPPLAPRAPAKPTPAPPLAAQPVIAIPPRAIPVRAASPAPLPPTPPTPRAQVMPYVPPQTKPIARATASMRHESIETTAPFDYEDYTSPTVEMPPPPVIPIARPPRAQSASPATVIPVPKLPSLRSVQAQRLEPVVRPLPAAPRRVPASTRAPASNADPTTRTHAAPPPPDDRTSPSLVLPRAAAR